MIACFDVYYHAQGATAAGLTIADWKATKTESEFVLEIDNVGDYQAGEFYKRELAPLLDVIKQIKTPIRYYVIDAYCHLSPDKAPGLGAYLHKELPEDAIVIGVAKNGFRRTKHAVELARSGSSRRLYVTSIGCSYQKAANLIESMHGEFRMPTILKKVDQLSRSTAPKRALKFDLPEE